MYLGKSLLHKNKQIICILDLNMMLNQVNLLDFMGEIGQISRVKFWLKINNFARQITTNINEADLLTDLDDVEKRENVIKEKEIYQHQN
jgi:hypothetical protein